jgi:hypothetical protein
MTDVRRVSKALIVGLLSSSLSVSGCGTFGLDVACAATERMPTPVSAANMTQLEATKEAITDFAIGNPAWKINMVDADETTGTVAVGTSQRTQELCALLHAKFGAFVEVIDAGPAHAGMRDGVTFADAN